MIVETACYLNVTDKTLRQWLADGNKFPGARFDNRKGRGVWRIPDAEVEAIKRIIQDTGGDTDTIDNIAALEYQIKQLEARVQALEEIIRKKADTTASTSTPPDTIHTTTLPPGYVAFTPFIELHGVPETSANRWRKGPPIRASTGSWHDDLKFALDKEQQALFYSWFSRHAAFRRCPGCPHAAE